MDSTKSVFDHDASYFKLKEYERYIKLARVIVFVTVAMTVFTMGLFALGNGDTAYAARMSLVVAAVMFALYLYSYSKAFISILLLAILFATVTGVDVLNAIAGERDELFTIKVFSLVFKLALSVFMIYAATRARQYEKLKEEMMLNR